MMAVCLPGISDEADHSILFSSQRSPAKARARARKLKNLRVGTLVKQLGTLARVSAQRGIPNRRERRSPIQLRRSARPRPW